MVLCATFFDLKSKLGGWSYASQRYEATKKKKHWGTVTRTSTQYATNKVNTAVGRFEQKDAPL